jgi:hypothetical protein
MAHFVGLDVSVKAPAVCVVRPKPVAVRDVRRSMNIALVVSWRQNIGSM